MDNYQSRNGYGNGYGNTWHPDGHPGSASRPDGLRIPTVAEALPYTPFSSIIPFNPGIIPPPLAVPTTAPTVFGNVPEILKTQHLLHQLSAGATNAQSASDRCQKTLRDVQRLLDGDSLTQYNFKVLKRSRTKNTIPVQSNKRKSALSPFAGMVFDSTNVNYRYLTPESPDLRAKPGEPESDPDNILVLPRQSVPTPQSRPQQSRAQKNGHLTAQHPQPPLGSQGSQGSQGSKLKAIVVPNLITPAQRAEYQYMPAGDTIVVVQKNTNPSKQWGNFTNRTVTVDQKRKGDVAVQELESLLHDIFEAEDQLQPDTSGVVSLHANAIFATSDVGEGTVPVLQLEAQKKLDVQMHRVVVSGRLESIDLESLARIQKICESATNAAEVASLGIGDDWSETDTQDWLFKLATAERALVAARTLLQIMGAASRIKELQSEDLLRATFAVLTTVVDTCIVPTVEERPSMQEKVRGVKDEPPSNPKFIIASAHRQPLQTLLHTATKALRLLGDFLVQSEVDESRLSTIEFLCKTLIFAENASHERESILGIETFETTRRCAMDVLAKDFTQYPDQRRYILQDILTSLEKLPANKQSARHYRLLDAKPIQLVSALLMRLVQTSATTGSSASSKNARRREGGEPNDDNEDDADTEDSDEDSEQEGARALRRSADRQTRDLASMVRPLHDAAQSNASYIVRMLMQKALTTSKSSDEPHRKLLDIFTEDFMNVLGSSDWPAAELLLRTFVSSMIGLVENPKSPAPSRTLALELLGTIGSGILKLQIAVRSAARSLDAGETDISQRLGGLVQELENGHIETESLVSFDGPYRMMIEYLQARGVNDAQLHSARGFHVMQWASYIADSRQGSIEPNTSAQLGTSEDLQSKIRNMLADPHWLEEYHDFPSITTAEGRMAAMIIASASKLCKAFNRILNVLLSALSSEHPTVKSRSLKSVDNLLEKDPSLLDRHGHVLNHIFRCATDASPLVRDSALKLIDECISKRPLLDGTVYPRVVERTRDASLGVRKRAMKMLKEIYLRNDSLTIRSAIADALIARMEDLEDSVKDIARQTVEDVWFLPLHRLKLKGDNAVEAKLQYGFQVGLLVHTVDASDSIGDVLEVLIKELVTQSKMVAAHVAVCNTLVKVLFDGVIDSSGIPGKPEQSAILRCLAVFAKASPKLFSAAQLERLEPYTQNLTSNDDLEVYRSAIAILRHVMPHQPTLKQDFLQKMQTSLLTNASKLPKSELAEVVPCLWTINGMLGNIERLVKFVSSALRGVHSMRSVDLAADPQAARKAAKLMAIVGQFGKTCDFDEHLPTFKEVLPSYKGKSVAGLIVEILSPFTSPKQPLAIREVSLEAVCTVSQAWPKLFLRPDVVNAFELVFRDKVASLEQVLLHGLEGFFSAQELSKGGESTLELGSGVATGQERLGKTYVATDQDGASTTIAQRFMQQILRLALTSSDELAMIASRLIVSINRQGLVHPKESGPALVALETCPNSAIANMAFAEHKAQHSKHESLFDKEYMRAVQQAFDYQRDTLGSTTGFVGQPPVAKMSLLWEVLKTGKAQVRKKFLSNISQKMDFSIAKINGGDFAPLHLLFVRFCSENLALFDYDRVDELLHLLACMEKIFSSTGTAIAQAIESEVLKLHVNIPLSSDGAKNDTSETVTVDPVHASIDPVRLRQLAVASQICSLIWETRSLLRRLWNMQKYSGKPKNAAKEINRAPARVPSALVLTNNYLTRVAEIMSANASEDTQRAICSSFVELISVDSEVKVGSEEDDNVDAMGEEGTPSEGSSRKSPSVPPAGSGRGRKRKSVGANGTPRKKARPSVSKRKSSSAKLMDGEDDEDGGWE